MYRFKTALYLGSEKNQQSTSSNHRGTIMAEINHRDRRADVKIVYYGPAYAGKTTSLQYLFKNMDPKFRRGELLTTLPPLRSDGDRTLFFDVLPMQEVLAGGIRVAFKLWTLPGQPQMDGTRKVVVRNADAVAFIADSQYDRAIANLENFVDLQQNLREQDRCLTGFENDTGNQGLLPMPWVLFYNKRDMDAEALMPVSYMDLMFEVQQRNILRYYGSCLTGENVFRTANMLLYRAVEDGVLSQLRSREITRPAD